MTAAGLFIPLDPAQTAAVYAAVHRAGLPATPDGVRAWVLSMARPRRVALAGAVAAARDFAKQNPELIRDGLTIGRAILKLRQ